MTTEHLNLKWSVADTDFVLRMAEAWMTDLQISMRFKRWKNRDITREEIARICKDAGRFVKSDKRASA